MAEQARGRILEGDRSLLDRRQCDQHGCDHLSVPGRRHVNKFAGRRVEVCREHVEYKVGPFVTVDAEQNALALKLSSTDRVERRFCDKLAVDGRAEAWLRLNVVVDR